MSDKTLSYVKGDIVVTSQGEYSDYSVNTIFRVLKDFNIQSILQTWILLDGSGVVLNDDGTINTYESEGDPDVNFFNWLVESKIIEDLDYKELHTGDYGNMEFTSYRD